MSVFIGKSLKNFGELISSIEDSRDTMVSDAMFTGSCLCTLSYQNISLCSSLDGWCPLRVVGTLRVACPASMYPFVSNYRPSKVSGPGYAWRVGSVAGWQVSLHPMWCDTLVVYLLLMKAKDTSSKRQLRNQIIKFRLIHHTNKIRTFIWNEVHKLSIT